jgi:N-dimethylarginine dimethylaminohydrolase
MNSEMNGETTLARTSQPRFLICPPRHFSVYYSINPWMDPQAWADGGAALHSAAGRQWTGLRRALRAAGAAIETLKPTPGLPDLVFTANVAVVGSVIYYPAAFTSAALAAIHAHVAPAERIALDETDATSLGLQWTGGIQGCVLGPPGSPNRRCQRRASRHNPSRPIPTMSVGLSRERCIWARGD